MTNLTQRQTNVHTYTDNISSSGWIIVNIINKIMQLCMDRSIIHWKNFVHRNNILQELLNQQQQQQNYDKIMKWKCIFSIRFTMCGNW